MNERDLFIAALQKDDPSERAAYLAQACASDEALRQRIDHLLQLHHHAGSILGSPVAALAASVLSSAGNGAGPPSTGKYHPSDEPAAGVAGARVGHYKLLQKLGEGGMGTVWMAEQEQPVRRMVAVKLVKPGMDSAQVVARFEAERQALALMDHPHIAKVLDAGTTETGRPYFVMELVKGIPITKFCDEYHLTPRQRLELFIPVCQAVQHAHQKGIIHRDLKPSNVMVALYDDKPVPKIIDFGVAKALSQRLTERTMYTEFGALVGTLEYMSPEQAKLNALDVDTRSDVYSLGVILYELLAGSTPFDRRRLRSAALDELLRIIREEEPPKPSTRLSTSGAGLPSLAAVRGTEPAKLSRLMRGELDWIVMKALEKDRTRRYETANGLARDLQRFLADEPVEACPPSAAYRMRKFARKHRPAFATAATFAALLLLGTAVSAWQALRATRAEHLAHDRLKEVEQANAQTTAALRESEESRQQAQAVSRQLVEVFRSPDPEKAGRDLKVVDLLDQAAKKVQEESAGPAAVRAELLSALGETYGGLGLYRQSLELFQQALALRQKALGLEHPDTLTSMYFVADVYRNMGRLPEAEALHKQTLALRRATLGPDHPDTLTSMNWLARTYRDAGKTTEAIELFQKTLALRQAKLGPDHRDTLATMFGLGGAYEASARSDEAVPLYEKILPLQKAQLGLSHPDTLSTLNNLGNNYCWTGRYPEAIALFDDALSRARVQFGPEHPETLSTMANLAMVYEKAGRFPEALQLATEAFQRLETKLGPRHIHTINSAGALERALVAAGQFAEAQQLLEKELDVAKSYLAPNHDLTLAIKEDLAKVYRLVGRLAEAQDLYEGLVKHWKDENPNPGYMINTMGHLAIVCQARGDYARAESLLREVLDAKRKNSGADSPDAASALAWLGMNSLKQQKYAEAELVLRECLAIREKKLPDDFARFSAQSQLGAALFGQRKYDEAEPLLLSGYEGMKQRSAKIPVESRDRLTDALERLVQLYEATNKPDEAAKWRKELEVVRKN